MNTHTRTTTLLAVLAMALLAGPAPGSAQPADPEGPAGDSPVDLESIEEPEAPEEEAAPTPVEESGPGAELRKALERLKSEPGQLKPGSEVEQTLARLAAGPDGLIEAIYDLGVFHLRLNDLDKASQYFQEALGKDPDHAEAVAQLGVIAERRGQPDKAAALLDQALAMDKYCSPARNHLSQKALDEGKPDDAIRHCRIALLGDPDNMNAYLNMAIALFKKEQYDVGELVCESALRIDKNNAPIINLLGLIQLKRDDVKGAITLFTAAVAADPEYLDARKNLAAVALNFKDFKMASRELEEVLKREPDSEQFRTIYAVSLRGLRRFDESHGALKAVLDRNPRNLEAHYNLCILLHEYIQDLQAALDTCTSFADAIDRNHPKHQEMTLRMKGIRETIKAMEEMKRLQPETPPVPEEEKAAPEKETPLPEGPPGGTEPGTGGEPAETPPENEGEPAGAPLEKEGEPAGAPLEKEGEPASP